MKSRALFLGFVGLLALVGVFGGASRSSASTPSTGYLFWGNEVGAATVGRANIDGTGANTSLISATGGPYDTAANANYVYWTNGDDGTIGRANLDGTNVNETFITGTSKLWPRIAIDAGHIYWTNTPDPPYATNLATIGRANINGTGVDPNFITFPPYYWPTDIAVDANHIYWANSGQGYVGRADINGTNVDTTLISGLSGGPPPGPPCACTHPDGIAVDANHMYIAMLGYTAGDHGRIARADLDGTNLNLTFITVNGPAPISIATDAGHIYWVENNFQRVGRADLNGSNVIQDLIPSANAVSGIAVSPAPQPQPQTVSCSQVVRPASPANNLSGIWISNQGGKYYVRQIGSCLYWVGLGTYNGTTHTYNYANAYFGKVSTASTHTITGPWFDVNAGASNGHGQLTLKVVNATHLTTTVATGGFGAGSWTKQSASTYYASGATGSVGSTCDASASAAPAVNDLPSTVAYPNANPNATTARYNVRQIGSCVVLWGRPKVAPQPNSWAYSPVYFGSSTGSGLSEVVSGFWADVPAGTSKNFGKLTLRVTGTNKFTAIGTGGWLPITLYH